MPDQTNGNGSDSFGDMEGGTLILVAGASGAGKDTLIDAARDEFGKCETINFPRRFITRQDASGEDHIPIAFEDFAALRDQGGFFLHWQAHGLLYGLPAEILKCLDQGSVVVVNVSRRIIKQALEKWEKTTVFHVVANPSVLQERLRDRGRESEQDILARITRDNRLEVPEDIAVLTIDNSGELSTAVKNFNSELARIAQLPSG